MNSNTNNWNLVIQPKQGLFDINLKEIWRYRDLVFLLVKRDFVALYKQTVLGPLWFVIQPVLTTLIYIFIFGNLAGISTDGAPMVLFYMAGVTCWSYFSESLTKTSDTFIANANIFGKVYFPRVVIPISIILSSMIRLGVQLVLFIIFLAYYMLFTDQDVHFTWAVGLFPVLIVLMGLQGLGLGLIISSMTSKYRDLKFLLTFGIQLLMYATTVVYPLSTVPEKYKWIIVLNPFTAILETFRYGFLGTGEFYSGFFIYSIVATMVVLVIGILIFNRVEKNFMDTV